MTDLTVIEDPAEIYNIENPVEVECHIATSKTGEELLNSLYTCNVGSEIETIEGKKKVYHQLRDTYLVHIDHSITYSSKINRYHDWVDILYEFAPHPDLSCRIYRKHLTCKKDWRKY